MSSKRHLEKLLVIIGNRSNERVEESANRLHCKKVRLDGTKSIEDSIGRIMCVLEEIGIG